MPFGLHLPPAAVARQIHRAVAPQEVTEDSGSKDDNKYHAACLTLSCRPFKRKTRHCSAPSDQAAW
ncbi:hypothetical protein RA26_07130 [Leisingera sp. ANG-M7]|nr:hypothetical protein RA26_07130 [Leisingera sp. ANG-M7]